MTATAESQRPHGLLERCSGAFARILSRLRSPKWAQFSSDHGFDGDLFLSGFLDNHGSSYGVERGFAVSGCLSGI